MAKTILQFYCFPFFLITFCSISLALQTISLRSSFTSAPATQSWERVNQLASSSLARAHHIKHPKAYNSLTKTQVFTDSHGGYFVSLSFGTPPQTMDFLLDTGSSMTWFPCTHSYNCSDCNFSNNSPTNISTFLPELSTSSKILSCKSPECALLFKSDRLSSCRNCDEKLQNCTQNCPPYSIEYGRGSTRGQFLSETLRFPDKSSQDFIVGCSIQTSQFRPYGIVGFGRGTFSLPSQMGLKKFSYCLASNPFDDTSKSGELVLVSQDITGSHANLSYTPFFTSQHHSHYYVNLRKITLGGVNINIPYKFLVPGATGHGGTILDSGTTFTVMEDEAFEPLAKELEKQMAHHHRAMEVENLSGLRPCYNVSGDKSVDFPELVFHFKGGAKMVLQMPNYLIYEIESEVLCLTIIPFSTINPELITFGPSIIFGSYQQQKFYLEFDLDNKRIGLQKQAC